MNALHTCSGSSDLPTGGLLLYWYSAASNSRANSWNLKARFLRVMALFVFLATLNAAPGVQENNILSPTAPSHSLCLTPAKQKRCPFFGTWSNARWKFRSTSQHSLGRCAHPPSPLYADAFDACPSAKHRSRLLLLYGTANFGNVSDSLASATPPLPLWPCRSRPSTCGRSNSTDYTPRRAGFRFSSHNNLPAMRKPETSNWMAAGTFTHQCSAPSGFRRHPFGKLARSIPPSLAAMRKPREVSLFLGQGHQSDARFFAQPWFCDVEADSAASHDETRSKHRK